MGNGPCQHALASTRIEAKRWETRIDLHTCLEHARVYFEDHGHEPGAVGNAARFAGLSRAHFIRVFTESYGISPREHVFRTRMRRASKALASGASVAESAVLAGYTDANAFGRAFKRWSGDVPSQHLVKRAQTAGYYPSDLAQDVPHE